MITTKIKQKKRRIPCENYENHEDLRIPLKNYESHFVFRIILENYENIENH